MPEDILPPNIKRFAAIQAVFTEGLGFGGDKLRSVLDRSDEFAEIAHERNIISATKDDLDAFSVAEDMPGHLERMQKAEDN